MHEAPGVPDRLPAVMLDGMPPVGPAPARMQVGVERVLNQLLDRDPLAGRERMVGGHPGDDLLLEQRRERDSRVTAAQLGGPCSDRLERPQCAAREGEQRLALGGRCHAPRTAHEQLQSQLGLQALDLVGQRGLRDVQLRRGARDAVVMELSRGCPSTGWGLLPRRRPRAAARGVLPRGRAGGDLRRGRPLRRRVPRSPGGDGNPGAGRLPRRGNVELLLGRAVLHALHRPRAPR